MNLQIDRLILDGLPVSAHQAAALRAAICDSLADLLAGTDVAGVTSSAAVSAPAIVAHPDPTILGRRIAASIHHGLSSGGTR
jgi:hypothetical protein